MTHKRAIQVARKLFDSTEAEKWPLAEHLLEVIPEEGAEVKLRSFSEEMQRGIGWKRLAAYRETAKAWPQEARKRCTFEAHEAANTDPTVLLDGMTPEDVAKALGKSPSQVKSAAKVERVTKQLYTTLAQIRAKGVRANERKQLQALVDDMLRAAESYKELVADVEPTALAA